MLTFRCFCRSPSIKVTRVRHDDSTSNLVRHAKACDGGMIRVGSSGSITAFAQGSTYTPQKFRMKLAIWVARRHRPFAIVEDDELIDIFMDLNNKVEVPSRFTVSRDVKEIFDMSRVKVAAILKVRVLAFHFDLALISLRHIRGSFISVPTVGHRLMSSHLLVSLSTGPAQMAILNQQYLIL
jgi:hypothetical protein